ncbi:hypothetical protein PYW08_016966 [Mythimna loreyi]|nr:hypothetical protein PYW08_016966 [Mythimna loreyi]
MMYVKKMANDMSVVLTKGSQNKMNKVRKRKINMQEWKDIKRKRARDHGEEYISKRGVHVPAKIPPSIARICKDVCKKEGCASLTLEKKLEYYQDYYKLSYDDQSCFLMQCMTTQVYNGKVFEIILTNFYSTTHAEYKLTSDK